VVTVPKRRGAKPNSLRLAQGGVGHRDRTRGGEGPARWGEKGWNANLESGVALGWAARRLKAGEASGPGSFSPIQGQPLPSWPVINRRLVRLMGGQVDCCAVQYRAKRAESDLQDCVEETRKARDSSKTIVRPRAAGAGQG